MLNSDEILFRPRNSSVKIYCCSTVDVIFIVIFVVIVFVVIDGVNVVVDEDNEDVDEGKT